MELELTKFIEQNSNWKELLSAKPYSITIKEDGHYYLFSYSQIDSDFSLRIVQECRGIILRKSDMKPVCMAFLKFHNVQEGHAAEIDWSTARVQEKVDGSILKTWWDEYWHVSTNGTINSADAELQLQAKDIKNYWDLFVAALEYSTGENPSQFFARLNPFCTYMFEVVSPLNRVVVPYTETNLYHIGTRDISTLEELDVNIGIRKPREYELTTLEDCLKVVEDFPFSEEGFVVSDSSYNRIKIKSPKYIIAHHLRNNGMVTKARVLDMILTGEQSEFLGYYPEYTDLFLEVENGLARVLSLIENDCQSAPLETGTRKDFAMWASRTAVPACMYSLYDGKFNLASDWLYAQSHERILTMIEKFAP